MGSTGIAPLDQVPACVAGQLAQGGAVGGGQIGGQHVRRQSRPPGPGDRIRRVAGVAGGQQRLSVFAGGSGLGGGEPFAQDGLGEPVHLQPAVIDTGQRLPRQMGQGLPPGQRVRGPGRQLAGQDADGGGEQALRDRFGCQERAHAGQLGRGRVLAGEPVRNQAGGGRQRPRVRPRRPLGQQLPGPGPQQHQELIGCHAGVRHEPRRLGDGQRQVPELGGEPVRVGSGEHGDPGLQDRHRLGPGEHVHLDRRGDLVPAPLPGGDQHVPAAARQPRCHVRGVLGVVEDQQPPAAVPQLGQHRRPHRLGPGPGLHASQRKAKGGDLVPDQPALLGVDPPGQVIGPGEPVRVLGCQLGLAHPTHPVQRLHHRLIPGQQLLPHLSQQIVPAGEPRITGGDVPHPRPRPPHGPQHLRSRDQPAGRRHEQRAHRLGQAQRAAQQHGGVLAGSAVDAPLQVTDRPRAQARRLRQLLLRQPGLGPQLPQQPGKPQRRLLRHGPGIPSAGPHPAAPQPGRARKDLHQQ